MEFTYGSDTRFQDNTCGLYDNAVPFSYRVSTESGRGQEPGNKVLVHIHYLHCRSKPKTQTHTMMSYNILHHSFIFSEHFILMVDQEPSLRSVHMTRGMNTPRMGLQLTTGQFHTHTLSGNLPGPACLIRMV